MADLTRQNTKLWLIPEFHNLELFRAQAIHYSYARHAHPSYSIGVIEAGVGGNYYRGETYLAPPKSVVLMNPEEVHTGYSAEDLPLTYRMLYPRICLIQAIAEDLEIDEVPYFRDAVIENTALSKRVLNLLTTLEKAHCYLEQESLLIESLSAIFVQYGDCNVRLPRSPQEHQAVRLVKEYIHDNFSSPISLTQLAAIAQLNRSYLIRIFRQAVGMPPYAYLTQVRVRKAKQLLEQGMSVAAVAIAVGMSDQSHLTRHFRQILGVTPGAYRQMST
ncbi:MAG: AraC family transcriptional regulator, partial [Cyanobacteria bacterium J06626_18]